MKKTNPLIASFLIILFLNFGVRRALATGFLFIMNLTIIADSLLN